MPRIPQISDAEWSVMNAVWEGEPASAQEVIAHLGETTDWSPATIKTMLHRLVKKGALRYQREGNRYLYRAAAPREACVHGAIRSFLDRVLAGETAPMLAQFVRSAGLSRDDIAQLKQLLDDMEDDA